MKLNAEYDHHSQVVELRYDNEAQVVFGATGQVMNRLLKPPGSPDFLEQEPDWPAIWAYLLTKLTIG